MIKLRLIGLPDEQDQFAAWLGDQPGMEVLETGARYPDRDSQIYRQHIETEVRQAAGLTVDRGEVAGLRGLE